VPIRPDRGEQIAGFCLVHAERRRRAIAGKTSGVDAALIDDACAVACEKLLTRPDIDLKRPTAFWWLYQAPAPSVGAGTQQRCGQPSGSLSGTDDDTPEPMSSRRSSATSSPSMSSTPRCAICQEPLDIRARGAARRGARVRRETSSRRASPPWAPGCVTLAVADAHRPAGGLDERRAARERLGERAASLSKSMSDPARVTRTRAR